MGFGRWQGKVGSRDFRFGFAKEVCKPPGQLIERWKYRLIGLFFKFPRLPVVAEFGPEMAFLRMC